MIIDTVIYWVRSDGPNGKDRVPMYCKGVWGQNNGNGAAGDVLARPVSLGPGPYTATYGPHDFEYEDESPALFGTAPRIHPTAKDGTYNP